MLVAVVLVSIVRTTLLIVLTLSPNATANYLMDTAELDNGQFWLIVDPEYSLKVLSVIALVVVDACYLFILHKLVSWWERYPEATSTGKGTSCSWACATAVRAIYHRAKTPWGEIAGIRGKFRKYWVSKRGIVNGVSIAHK